MAYDTIEIPLAVQSFPQEFREQGDERMINCFASRTGQGKNTVFTLRMSPGFTTFSTGALDIALRGSILSGDYIYSVFETGVYKVNSAGTRTLIGAVSGTGPVYMALNTAGQIGVVNALGRYYVIQNDIITSVNTTDIGAFNSICWIAGYFILTLEDGRFFNTALNDAFSINGLDFATAEGSPDKLLGGIALKNELFLVGKDTIEVWALLSSPPARGSPFARQGSWIPKGTLSFASVIVTDNTLKWVGNDRIVYQNENYNAKRISHEGVERAIAAAASPETIKGFTYTIDGHIFYGISDANFTWVQDAKERLWHERKSYLRAYWKANVFINAFGKWLCGATDDGNIYQLDMNSRTEGTDPIIAEIHSIDTGRGDPGQASVAIIEMNALTGRASLSGTIPQTAPFLQISHSDDGGQFYSIPRFLALGAHGGYTKRVRANRLGQTGIKFGRRWKVVNADPHIFAVSYTVARVEGGARP